ncbi:MAG: ADP-glyceromanno-heptose 6-epimerase [Pseudomonadota bacterium]|jgi:ADP-L-glycero-D-manno-heptose 6-epimerase
MHDKKYENIKQKPIIVTGGAGFIGSNIVEVLNKRGYKNIIVVDNLKNAAKFKNIVDLEIVDFIDKNDFMQEIIHNPQKYKDISAIFHEGACSDTMEHDGHYMMKNNFEYSKNLFNHCQEHKIPFLYASSAATYGNDIKFKEERACEQPLNVYGYSKLLFDNYVRYQLQHKKTTAQVVGFRYFNVYGPRECHKGKMASVAFHHYVQYAKDSKVKLFGEYADYGAGEHTRDFIYVGDVVEVNLRMWESGLDSGIFNLGTGKAEPFNNIAISIINNYRKDECKQELQLHELVEQNLLEYIDFPASLHGKYQSYTQANLHNLRSVIEYNFLSVAQGIEKYYAWLKDNYSRFYS